MRVDGDASGARGYISCGGEGVAEGDVLTYLPEYFPNRCLEDDLRHDLGMVSNIIDRSFECCTDRNIRLSYM